MFILNHIEERDQKNYSIIFLQKQQLPYYWITLFLSIELRYKGTRKTVIVWWILNRNQSRIFISIYQIVVKLIHCSIILVFPVLLYQTLKHKPESKLELKDLTQHATTLMFIRENCFLFFYIIVSLLNWNVPRRSIQWILVGIVFGSIRWIKG